MEASLTPLKSFSNNDPDDDNPLPNANSNTTSTNLQVQLFIQGGPAPGKMAAGSH